jgi:hypothetical protein
LSFVREPLSTTLLIELIGNYALDCLANRAASSQVVGEVAKVLCPSLSCVLRNHHVQLIARLTKLFWMEVDGNDKAFMQDVCEQADRFLSVCVSVLDVVRLISGSTRTSSSTSLAHTLCSRWSRRWIKLTPLVAWVGWAATARYISVHLSLFAHNTCLDLVILPGPSAAVHLPVNH